MPPSNRKSSPRASRTLQAQGVPIPAELRGQFREEAFREVPEQGARRTGIPHQDSSNNKAKFSPVSAGQSATSIGLLEAEFLATIGLLFLIMFSNRNVSYTSRIMSLMKRGTLACAIFFILSLVSTSGQGAARFAKAFGALVVVVILLTTPIYSTDASGNPTGVLPDIDALIKNDWAGSSESGGETGSADTGSASGSNSSIGQEILNGITGALQGVIPGQNIKGIVQGVLSGLGLLHGH